MIVFINVYVADEMLSKLFANENVNKIYETMTNGNCLLTFYSYEDYFLYCNCNRNEAIDEAQIPEAFYDLFSILLFGLQSGKVVSAMNFDKLFLAL